ncbi:MAG: SMI1/KNR4 family protein [Candidatus Hydrogenedentes bacterium]|nr:SMI1/KNR4 family protein [Candidatus Hydrogenedentota bacterium]
MRFAKLHGMHQEVLPPALDADIAKLESDIGFPLPADYKAFLRDMNGAQALDRCFYVRGLKQDIALHILLGVHPGRNWADLFSSWDEFNEDLPENALIIGLDPGANFLVLLLDGNADGVYYWDHKHFFPQSSDLQNMYFVSESFSFFIDELKPLLKM